jgi:predicted CoA-substrate-specific enzyme activase
MVMIYAGCDLGTTAAKVVITQNGNILSFETLAYKNLPKQAAIEVMERALNKASLREDQIDYCISTGFGKKAVPYADDDSPEIICINRAIRSINPDIRTVIDVGGQSIRVFNISDKGRVIDSATNEKCAAGTGKFIEVMARALELTLERVSQLPFESKNPLHITSQCGVFAESEVISHVNDGKDRADIVAGISRSVAGKISSLVGRISLDEHIAMIGGVAKNRGVVKYVEEALERKLVDIKIDSQIVGALGAALIAREKHAGQAQ